jgi:hypothetical protein
MTGSGQNPPHAITLVLATAYAVISVEMLRMRLDGQ